MNALKRFAVRLFGVDSVFARNTAGGIRPDPFKQHSLRSRIMSTPIPPLLRVPIGNLESSAITLFVKPGQRVCKYQQLACIVSPVDADSHIPVHAPTSGTVTKIDPVPVADHRSLEQICVYIETDGHDEAQALEGLADFCHLGSAELTARIRDAGIIGMGGAGFPSADKLGAAERFDIDLLIINAAECEPYISADEALIRERAERVLLGSEILRRACSASRAVVAIEETKTDAIAALQSAVHAVDAAENNCTIVLVPSKYPVGSEKQLIYCVTGIEVPSDRLPAHSGILMQNIGTAAAAYDAIVEGRPCISRITTLCGETLQTPKNFEVLIGSSVSFLFGLCGIDETRPHRSVVGGSLMGREIQGDEAVVCKTTNCVIAAGSTEFPEPLPERACIRCGFCADACPVNLLPQQLLAYSKTANSNALLGHGLFDCIECGACDYVCPSHIPLVSVYKENKNDIRARGEDVVRSEYWQQRFQYHQYRLKKEQDQSLARKTDRRNTEARIEKPATSSGKPGQQEIFSREKASVEIAAAVARVKARRSENAELRHKKSKLPESEPDK